MLKAMGNQSTNDCGSRFRHTFLIIYSFITGTKGEGTCIRMVNGLDVRQIRERSKKKKM